MKKSTGLLLLFCLIVSTLLAFRQTPNRFKNLKILPADITEKQLDSVMDHFNNSLGVKCGFCHVKNDKGIDYASDGNKHKLIARTMMEMTNKINDSFFNYTGEPRDLDTQLMVTCFTCHNGKKEPESIPAVMKKAGKKEKD